MGRLEKRNCKNKSTSRKIKKLTRVSSNNFTNWLYSLPNYHSGYSKNRMLLNDELKKKNGILVKNFLYRPRSKTNKNSNTPKRPTKVKPTRKPNINLNLLNSELKKKNGILVKNFLYRPRAKTNKKSKTSKNNLNLLNSELKKNKTSIKNYVYRPLKPRKRASSKNKPVKPRKRASAIPKGTAF